MFNYLLEIKTISIDSFLKKNKNEFALITMTVDALKSSRYENSRAGRSLTFKARMTTT